MGIADRTQELTQKIRNEKPSIETEEATKTAFVMPFISNVLGYDVFNPSEVIPEFTADVGSKKNEKVDYALAQQDKVQILIEVKKITEPLKLEHASQLFRYFSVTHARIAILTNGQVYEFYTDLDAPNCMDSKPFLVLDLSEIDETLLPEIAKLARDSFDLDSVLSAASELKYIGQIKRILAAEFKDPSSELVRFFAAQVYPGKTITQRVRNHFSPLVVKALNQFLNEQVNDRLKTALGDSGTGNVTNNNSAAETQDETATTDQGNSEQSAEQANEIVTTEDEVEGLRIVRAITCSEVTASRISGRDSKSYFAVLLDNNNRKPVARLWFNRAQKYIGLFDSEKNETRFPIDSPQDIYQHANQLRTAVKGYLSKPSSNGSSTTRMTPTSSADVDPGDSIYGDHQ